MKYKLALILAICLFASKSGAEYTGPPNTNLFPSPGGTPGNLVVVDTHGTGVADGGLPNGTSAPMTVDGIFNANATSMLHWRKALANVRAGLGRGKVVIIGASQSMGGGAGSGGTGELNGAQPFNWPNAFALLLNKYVPVVYGSMFCDANANAEVGYQTYDTRVTYGANWSVNGSACIGGNLFQYTTGAANNFSFTPNGISGSHSAGTFDTIKYWYFAKTTSGTSTINVDGGASLGTINYSTPNFTVQVASFSVSAATHTINVVPNNDGNFQILGFQTYLSTEPAIDIIDVAAYGLTAQNAAANSNSWNSIPVLLQMAPDLTVIGMSGNDCTGSTPIASYVVSMQTIITAALASGSVLLTTESPGNNSSWTSGACQPYINALQSLAVTNDVPFIDISRRWVSYAVMNPVFPYGDSNHPGKLGYQDWAMAILKVLLLP